MAKEKMKNAIFKKIIVTVTLAAFLFSLMPVGTLFAARPSSCFKEAGTLRQLQSRNTDVLADALGNELNSTGAGAIGNIEWELETPDAVFQLAIKEVLSDANVLSEVMQRLEKRPQDIRKISIKHHEAAIAEDDQDFIWYIFKVTFKMANQEEVSVAFKILASWMFEDKEFMEKELPREHQAYQRLNQRTQGVIAKLLAYREYVEEYGKQTSFPKAIYSLMNDSQKYNIMHLGKFIVEIVEFVPIEYNLWDDDIFIEKAVRFWEATSDNIKNRFLPDDLNPGSIHFFRTPQGVVDGHILVVGPKKSLPSEDALLKYLAKYVKDKSKIQTGISYITSKTGGNIVEAAAIGQKDRIYLYSLKAIRKFGEIYHYNPEGVVYAPSRINIIGEHIDYVDYLPARVLPFASAEYGMFMAFAPRKDMSVETASTNPNFPKRQFDMKNAPKGEDWLQYLAGLDGQPTDWSSYIKGSCFYLQNQMPDKKLVGMDNVVVSNIPVSSGASSSSALTVASGYAFRVVNGLPIDLDELADSSSKAEWFIGTRGGKMDQATISLGQADKVLSMRFKPFSVTPVTVPNGYKIVTFFTTKHAGGSQLDSEYNERSAISRFVIPSALEEIFISKPKLRVEWERFKKAIEDNDLETIASLKNTIEELINLLPESLTLNEIAVRYPSAFTEIAKEKNGAYKALFELKQNKPLKIRDRSRHHIEEIIRVIMVEKLLAEASKAQQNDDPNTCGAKMQEVGRLLDETHSSLRDLYNISTPDIEEVIKIVHGLPGVLGARLMGGGFGGNVEVLVEDNEKTIKSVIQAARDGYYIPRGRDGIAEGSINIHTPGDGASYTLTKDIKQITSSDRERLQRQLILLLSDPFNIGANRELIDTLIEHLRISRPVIPVIIAAGKSTRYQNSLPQGTKIHSKVVAEVNGEPSIKIVLETIESLYGKDINFKKPVVIHSRYNEQEIKDALADYDVDYVLQDPVVGTGNAALQLRNKTEYENFDGDLLIFYSTNPVIRPETLSVSIKIKQALDHLKITQIYKEPEIIFSSDARCALVYPATWRKKPYAPLKTDPYYKALVLDSQETHLEGAQAPDGGLDNIGAYIVDAQYMFEELSRYDAQFNGQEYEGLPNGELGLPNTLGHNFPEKDKLVIAAPIADERESIGIKTYADTKRAEKYMKELEMQKQAAAAKTATADAAGSAVTKTKTEELAKTSEWLKQQMALQDAALVIGPDDAIRLEMVVKLETSGLYAKVIPATDEIDANEQIEQNKEQYTIGLVVDCSGSDVNLASRLNIMAGNAEIPTIKTRDPEAIEAALQSA